MVVGQFDLLNGPPDALTLMRQSDDFRAMSE